MNTQTLMTAEHLIAKGYRVVSRKHKLIARVDRPDWREFLKSCGLGHCDADFYRRVYSKDCITVSRDVLQDVPNSNADPVGYVGERP